jgi:type IV secretion system protein VirB4
MDVEVKRGLKTDRKKDAIYVFSTQEPNDALESRIGKTIMQQCVTKILLENPEADPVDYMKGLKLTEAEYQALLNIPEFSRQFLVKQGSQSAIATMDLRGMEKAISILSGTPDNAGSPGKHPCRQSKRQARGVAAEVLGSGFTQATEQEQLS